MIPLNPTAVLAMALPCAVAWAMWERMLKIEAKEAFQGARRELFAAWQKLSDAQEKLEAAHEVIAEKLLEEP